MYPLSFGINLYMQKKEDNCPNVTGTCPKFVSLESERLNKVILKPLVPPVRNMLMSWM